MDDFSQLEPAYTTDLGRAFVGDSREVLSRMFDDESVDLIVTSPPYALQRPKEYGNVPPADYVEWFLPFADEFWRVLKPTGSLVIDLGGGWESGVPVKSLYAFELLITLCRRPSRPFFLAQDFYWFNPAKLPSPAVWVTINRVRVKDAVNYVWWLSKTPSPKADNSRVVRGYTDSMKRLLESGSYNRGPRPSGHVIREGFTHDRGGSIPSNLLAISNTGNDQNYTKSCKDLGFRVHPARFAPGIPEFFIDMLTEEGDHVLDPFCGSNITGFVAESRARSWTAIDIDADYVSGSEIRFSRSPSEARAEAAGQLRMPDNADDHQ